MKSEFGEKLKVVISGGSHEPSVNVSISGLPKDFVPDMEALQVFLNRRAPGKSRLTSSRREADVPNLVASGTGAFEFSIANKDIRPGDYHKFRYVPRPGHADYTGRLRYGEDFNLSGGGPFSGRMTAPLCVVGGLAMQVLSNMGIHITSEILSAGGSADVEAAVMEAAALGDSVGALVRCTAVGVPGGIGDAMYSGLESRLSTVLFGIPAVKGVEFGAGFQAAHMKGSENNDSFYCDGYCDSSRDNTRKLNIKTKTNNSGGILGGISTGMPIIIQVAFKPTPSIAVPQESVDLRTGESVTLEIDGRHDPCVAIRGRVAVEAAVALGLLDAILCCEPAAADLPGLRSEIDETDRKILRLINRRMEISRRVAAAKEASGRPLYDPAREAEILNRVSAGASPELAETIRKIYTELFAASKSLQKRQLMESSGAQAASSSGDLYGLIGTPLSHSFSKEVHEALGKYSFNLVDIDPQEMKAFLAGRNFKGLSVTRPYKQDVIPFCHRLTDRAKAIGAVNTLYWEKDPSGERILVGHNTDYDGFLYTATRSGIAFAGKTVLILGTGGTSRTVTKIVTDQGAKAVYYASRKPCDREQVLFASGGSVTSDGSIASHVVSYGELADVGSEIDIVVNTTPVGTYPGNLEGLIDLTLFPNCRAVVDVVYNPNRTALILQAQTLGMQTAGGMPMIVAQAVEAAKRFLGEEDFNVDFAEETERILSALDARLCNIVLIGMPGCGKTVIGERLVEMTGKTFVDIDHEIQKRLGRSPAEIINENGESYFRDVESAVISEFGKLHGQVIATGGGAVLRENNFASLKQNGLILWIKRDLSRLPIIGRPLSEGEGTLEKLYEQRAGLYEKWSDFSIESDHLIKLLKLL